MERWVPAGWSRVRRQAECSGALLQTLQFQGVFVLKRWSLLMPALKVLRDESWTEQQPAWGSIQNQTGSRPFDLGGKTTRIPLVFLRLTELLWLSRRFWLRMHRTASFNDVCKLNVERSRLEETFHNLVARLTITCCFQSFTVMQNHYSFLMCLCFSVFTVFSGV